MDTITQMISITEVRQIIIYIPGILCGDNSGI